ncbi:winged helix-turn-helix transcriptional regulator [Prochlorococcus sp. MIT 1223]|uniref:winged helix-turn-helix transcriptional regulator n=1 Tax=Prochlorococcus sp. MIT 1223 TaxID=3096217 RepID=UPI002A74B78B|nr:ArsR family transcriptional regulator [Prochlorococcus sp. MIT 1223]
MIGQVQVPTREAALSLLLEKGELSASSLSLSLGISVQAIRRHLRSLQNDGLVESISISLGPGRPSNVWHLTSKGHHCFFNEKGSEKFALELLDSIEKRLSPNILKDLLNTQAFEKAILYRRKIGLGKVQDRLRKLIELRIEEGHKADFYKCKDDSLSWYLNAFHCSIKGIAESFPVVCDQELQLIRYIFPDCNVERVQWRIDEAKTCGFKITPNKI